MMQRKVLFTGGGGAGSEALYRLLSERYEPHFADADPQTRPPLIPPSRWHRLPFASEPTFVDEVGRLRRSIDAAVLIPGVDEELLPLANARHALGCDLLLPPSEFIATHLDKLASARALSGAGLPAPVTEPALQRAAVKFPCICKPRSGRGSRGVAIVRSEEELHAHVLMSRVPIDDFIVQERVEGQEYTVTMVANRAGRLMAVVPVLVGVKRGITLRAHTDADSEVIAACRAIHESRPVPGCYNIQLVKGPDRPKPFEINPRISTTACLALAAGVDFIGLHLSDDRAGELAAFRNQVHLKRSWHNEFID